MDSINHKFDLSTMPPQLNGFTYDVTWYITNITQKIICLASNDVILETFVMKMSIKGLLMIDNWLSWLVFLPLSMASKNSKRNKSERMSLSVRLLMFVGYYFLTNITTQYECGAELANIIMTPLMIGAARSYPG